MNWLEKMFKKVLSVFKEKPELGHGISLLVPYKKNIDPRRDITWDWLKKYWRHELPGAEIIISSDSSHHHHGAFSKTTAKSVTLS